MPIAVGTITLANKISSPVNSFSVPNFFCTFPVRQHKDHERLQEASIRFAQECSKPGRQLQQSLVRHDTPGGGNVYSLVFCECELERLLVFALWCELAWVNDDLAETVAQAEGNKEHQILRSAFDPSQDANTDTGKMIGAKKDILRKVRKTILMVDPEHGSEMVESLNHFLKVYDTSDETFETLEAYIPYRVVNGGWTFSALFVRWGMKLQISEEELQSIHDYEYAIALVHLLGNDYYSYNNEKLHVIPERIHNAIPILMKEYNLPEDKARTLLRGMISDEEEKARRLLTERIANGPPMSEDLERYYEVLQLMAGGTQLWSATTGRYNRLEEHAKWDKE